MNSLLTALMLVLGELTASEHANLNTVQIQVNTVKIQTGYA
jgi:hypothetical protein